MTKFVANKRLRRVGNYQVLPLLVAYIIRSWPRVNDFFSILGTTKLERLSENLAATDIDVMPKKEKSIRQLADEVKGLCL